jgi:BirA family biotin operon repressor/biotin-[acetyl-CoA-carboxylase] ligase
MDICREFAEQGADEGLVVIADEQTAGRGRLGRAWFSPPGQSLYLSVLLRPKLLPRQISWLTMIGALAVVDSLSWVLGVDGSMPTPNAQLKLKWFNDVMLNGKKLAGVLVETALTGDQLDYAVLGVGMNVNTRFDEAPVEVQMRATSLRQTFGRDWDREAVFNRLLGVFGARYAALPASPAADYIHYLDTLGKRVRLKVGAEVVEGEAVRVEDDGALVVRTANGECMVRFGEVVTSA